MADWWPYLAAMVFLGTYPVGGALLWIAGAAACSYFREGDRADDRFYELEHHPQISAYEEELTIGRTLEAVMALDWPDLEVLVVDDGSSDRTAEIVRRYCDDPRVNLLSLPENGGKAGALNAGLPLLTSDYALMMDADGAPAPDALHWMAPHLIRLRQVAAVTGNPRVANHRTLLCRLQSVEFSATVSVLRRAQTTWGRLMTFSGICTLTRRQSRGRAGAWPRSGSRPPCPPSGRTRSWRRRSCGSCSRSSTAGAGARNP